MAVGSSGGKIEMDRGVYDALTKAGVGIRRAPAVHDKYFLVYGKFGSRYEYRVYTGSQNWSGSALNTNDEIFVKMAPGDELEPPALRRLQCPLRGHLASRASVRQGQATPAADRRRSAAGGRIPVPWGSDTAVTERTPSGVRSEVSLVTAARRHGAFLSGSQQVHRIPSHEVR